MIVYTIQMSQWRLLAEHDILLLNTTVKNGVKAFAPTWDIVLQVKAGIITPEEYTVVYRRLMTESFRNNRQTWADIIKGGPVAVGCMCQYGKFCHRHLLISYFQEICDAAKIDFEYRGEILKGKSIPELSIV